MLRAIILAVSANAKGNAAIVQVPLTYRTALTFPFIIGRDLVGMVARAATAHGHDDFILAVYRPDPGTP